MRELVVISGKGGTGKTTLTAAFAAVSRDRVLCDADVDAADLHLLMAPVVNRTTDFKGGGEAVIELQRCTACRLCLEMCRFDAISDAFVIDGIVCEGCGVCVDFCPERAIDFPTKTCGQWFISDTRFGPMVHARLGIAEENSGKLVTLVRQEAKKLAEARELDLIITDGPPGVGCPVIAAVGGASALLIVTEPTVSGVHDMARTLSLAEGFKVPALLCINKADLNPDQTAAIERMAADRDIPVVGKVPFDPVFTRSMVQGETVMEFDPPSPVRETVRQIWDAIMASDAMNGTSADHKKGH